MTRPPDAHEHTGVGAVVLATGMEQPEQSGQPFDPYWAVVDRKPLLAWAVAALAQTPDIGALVLVVAPGRVAEAQALVEVEGWRRTRVVAGNGGLIETLRAGMTALPAACAWVVVHDGARPLVTPELVAAGIAMARRIGVAGAAVATEPVKETIKRVRDGFVAETLDRSRLALLQTPQVFGRGTLLAALLGEASQIAAADTATLALAGGITLATFSGGSENLKVRAPEDLAVVARLLERREMDASERASKQGSVEKDEVS